MSHTSTLKFNVSLIALLAIVASAFALILIPFSPTRTVSCLRSEGAFTTSCLSESRATVHAQTIPKDPCERNPATGKLKSGKTFDENCGVFKPLGAETSIQQIIGKVIQALLGLTGLIALVMFITGGLRWMLAAGNQEAVSKAKKTITWAVLGLVMVFASYAIVNSVIKTLAPPPPPKNPSTTISE